MRSIYLRLFFVGFLVLIFSQIAFSQTKKSKTLPETSDEFQNLPPIVKLSGTHLKAISIAYSAFQTESFIPEHKRKIENYEIFVKHYKGNFYVYFAPKLAKDEEPSFGGESLLGKEVVYIIDEKKLKILSRYFMR